MLSLATLAADASASPEDVFGYGPRSPAMGGTGASTATSYDAAYANPALLSAQRVRTLGFGIQSAIFRLYARGDGLPGSFPADAAKGIVVGVGAPLPFGGILTDRVGIGIAFYSPTKLVVRGRILYPEKTAFPLLSDRTQSLMIRMGAGADLGYGVRVGGGFAALAELAGGVVAQIDASGHVGAREDDQLLATYAPTLGASWETKLSGGDLRVGAVYRGALAARFAVEVDASRISTLKIPVFNIAGLAQYDPPEAGVEASWSKSGWLVAAGVTYKKWSDYPGLLEPTIRCPDDDPDCGALAPPKIAFSDTLVPRVGVERTIDLARELALHLRAGYLLEPTPVPSTLASSQAWDFPSRQNVDEPTRWFDATRHVFSAGAGLELRRPAPALTLDEWTQVHVMPERTIATPPAGDAKVHGTVVAVGVVLGVAF